ncbi:hypothetical protein NL374_27510, partial [Klebsiella pneumoniae]|nr:hypothetical protein [Klebsiella pneumoniae]
DPNVPGAPVQAPGETPWLIAYAPLAWLCQLVLWSGMAWWLGGISSVLGILAGMLVAWQLLLKPGAHWARLLWQSLLWQDVAASTT